METQETTKINRITGKPFIKKHWYHCYTDGGNQLLLVSYKANEKIRWTGGYLDQEGKIIRPLVRAEEAWKFAQTWKSKPRRLYKDEYEKLTSKLEKFEKWFLEVSIKQLRIKRCNNKKKEGKDTIGKESYMLIHRKLKKAVKYIPNEEIIKSFCIYMKKYKGKELVS